MIRKKVAYINFKELHVNIKIRLFLNFIKKTTQTSIFPFMTIKFSMDFGMKIAGILMLISVIASILSSFYGGYLSDILGRKKILLQSEFVRLLSFLLMAWSCSPWFNAPILIFVFFLLNTIMTGISTPANDAIIIDVSTPENRKYIYSLNYWINNLSFSIGSLFGALFFNKYFFELLLCNTISSLISYVIIKLYLKDTNWISTKLTSKRFSVVEILKSYGVVIRDRRFLVYLLMSILLVGIEYQLGYYISARLLREFNTQVIFIWDQLSYSIDSVKMYGILQIENTICVVLLATIVAKLLNVFSNRIQFYIGVVIYTLGYATLAISNVSYVLLISMLVITIGELAYVPIQQSLMANLINEEKRSQYLAVNSLIIRGAMLLGALGVILGGLIPSWSMSIVYVIMGVVAILLYVKISSPKYLIYSQKI